MRRETRNMNWIMFAFVVPSVIAVTVAYIFTAYFVSIKSEQEKGQLWGALNKPVLFALTATTYTLSTVGCCISGFSFMLLEHPEYVSLCIFLSWNVSCVVFCWGMLHARRRVVLACLVTNTVCGIALFVYTGIVFDILQTVAQKPAVLVAHCFNAVGVFHVTIIDLVLWYDSWSATLRAREPPLIVVWAGEPDHMPTVSGLHAVRAHTPDQMRL
jgi:hypothetical protein